MKPIVAAVCTVGVVIAAYLMKKRKKKSITEGEKEVIQDNRDE